MAFINRSTNRSFHRRLYGGTGVLRTLTLLKRGDDQQSGQVRSVKLFNCRRGQVTKSGEPIQGDIAAGTAVTWHIPQAELDRAGVRYLSALDRLVDARDGHTWMPEADTNIITKLDGAHVCVDCKWAE